MRGWIHAAGMAVLMLGLQGCEGLIGPDLTGEFKLSSQLYGSESYYIFGYHYENGEMYKYPFAGEPVPDIINEGYLVIRGNDLVSLPGFNTPAQSNGFAKIGEFSSLDDARSFYEEYMEVEEDLQFETVSDTVELYQVWVQYTSSGNFAKLLVTDIREYQTDSGRMNNEVTVEYTYQPDGSVTFRE